MIHGVKSVVYRRWVPERHLDMEHMVASLVRLHGRVDTAPALHAVGACIQRRTSGHAFSSAHGSAAAAYILGGSVQSLLCR